MREPASFWRENVVAVVIIEAAKTREQMLEGDNFAIGRGRNLLHIQYVRLQNNRFFLSKSVKKSVKRGVRVIRASLTLRFQPRFRAFVLLLTRT